MQKDTNLCREENMIAITNQYDRDYIFVLLYLLSQRIEEEKDQLLKKEFIEFKYEVLMMNKSFGQRRYDWRSSHPLTSRRMMEVYEYIYKKYPEYLVNNPYKTNIYYQNFLLTSKENRAKFQEKVKTNSTKKVNYL